jgi:nucleotide-binding universal stress UspA family protein
MRILFAYDGSESAEAALLDLPRAGLPAGSSIVVMTVDDTTEMLVDFDVTTLTHHRHRLVDPRRIAHIAEDRIALVMPDVRTASMSALGAVADEITDTARQLDVDLIVLGAGEDRVLTRLHFGSNVARVLRRADRPVRVGRNRHPGRTRGPVRIVIGVDGSAAARAAIRAVERRTWPADRAVWLVTAIEPGRCPVDAQDDRTDATALHRLYLAELANSGIEARSIIRDGDAAGVLLSIVDETEADAVFLATHGLGGLFDALVGDTVTTVAERASCSVEIVRWKPGLGGV